MSDRTSSAVRPPSAASSAATIERPAADAPGLQTRERTAAQDHRFLRLALTSVNWLLLISIGALAWTSVREYSTQRYVDAFSDAIVPVSGSPEQKIQAILDWMAHPPARFTGDPVATGHDRDPIDTLNYKSLLQVCGTATNAFLNLADTSGLRARRLLLLDPARNTKHVDAEVYLDGRWIVVDPTFRTILRGPDGKTLTRAELADPAVFAAATRNIPNYDPSYSFENTVHVRLAGLRFVGIRARKVLNFVAPGWDDSAGISLVMERGTLGAVIAASMLTLFLLVARFLLRWYGRKRFRIAWIPVRLRLWRACQAFIAPVT